LYPTEINHSREAGGPTEINHSREAGGRILEMRLVQFPCRVIIKHFKIDFNNLLV